MYLSRLVVKNYRGLGTAGNHFELTLKRGLTVLVGENDAGKTAVIDALRLALGSTDMEWYRLEDSDFPRGDTSLEISVLCKFESLSAADKRAFAEYLTYGEPGTTEPVLFVCFTAKDTGEVRRGQPYRRVEVRSGKQGEGPTLAPEVRELLRATYLRPLRDAEQALTAGRGSRLSQVLHRTDQIKTVGVGYDPSTPIDPTQLNVLGIGDLANALLEKQQGIMDTRNMIDKHLNELSLSEDSLKSTIKVSGATASDSVRLRRVLEKLDLVLGGAGRTGLGSSNLLFIACELLLLAQEDVGNKMLLIEEPEAHLHAQRQLRVMKFLQEQADEKGIQVIVTTHSPNLASAVRLDRLVMIQNGRAFSLAEEETQLQPTDYRFLERFLDVTKANLFFARGVMIVEGDAENILVPTVAHLIGRDFVKYGVSMVNVGGVGLRRYARIFQRRKTDQGDLLNIPVACLTDMDVMPDCAGPITGRDLPTKGNLGQTELAKKREALRQKASGQCVETFVSDEWTLEYDLAFSGLAEDVYVAARLSKRDQALALTKKDQTLDEASLKSEAEAAQMAFKDLEKKARSAYDPRNVKGSSYEEILASEVYAEFTKGTKASKSIAAQYLAGRLEAKFAGGDLTGLSLRAQLPKYLVSAIDYVTSGSEDTYLVQERDDRCTTRCLFRLKSRMETFGRSQLS